MAKPANKKRGEVALPGFPAGTILRFTVDSFERIESELGDGWYGVLSERLSKLNIATIKMAIESGWTDPNVAIDFSPLNEPGTIPKVVDAIFDGVAMTIFGKTQKEVAEQAEKEELDRMLKKVEALKENPLLAADFLSKLGLPATEPDSGQTKSAASPQ